MPHVDSHLWSIILAGGDGERTKGFIRSTLGHDKPKQYCTFIGSRSLIQHTIDRADVLVPPSRRVIVTRTQHHAELTAQLRGREGGTVLYQPSNRGTAAGVFLPLAHVLSRDAEATVVIYPSDHFVYPESAFLLAIERAASLCSRTPEGVMVVGVRSSGPETDYGWIRPGTSLVDTPAKLRRVEGFVEKPPRAVAEQMARDGGLWNTSIIVARAVCLWQLGIRYLPDLVSFFTPIAQPAHAARDPAFGERVCYDDWRKGDPRQTGSRRWLMERIFRDVPVGDFSRDLLQPAARHLAVMAADGFFWSDWGGPARILDVIESYEDQRSLPMSGTALAAPA